jgi:hypothetical protein
MPPTPPSNRLSSRRREFLTGAVLFLASLGWFWFWRSNQYTGGDSGQWDRTIYEGWWLQRRQMLSFVTMQLTFQITNALWAWTSGMAIGLVSCASGAFAVVIFWRMLADRPAWGWALAAAASAGFTVIYYGHIETYAMSVTAMLLHLLAVKRTLEDRWPPWTLAATFTLMLCFHLIAVFIFPAAAWIALRENHRRGLGLRGIRSLLLAMSPAALIWLIGFSDFANFAFDEAVKKEFFVAPPFQLILKPWLIFTHVDARGDLSILHKLNFMLVDAGLFALLIPVVIFLFRRETLTLYFSAYLLCLLIWTAIWSPLQYAPDFDLFSFPWVVGIALVSLHLTELRVRSLWIGLLLGSNLLLFMARPAVFAELGNRQTAELTVLDSPWLEGTTVFLDESFKLPAGTYRHLPAAAHLISIRRPGWPMTRRVFLADEGDRWTVEIGEGSLELTESTP